jgi:hypothetical protein
LKTSIAANSLRSLFIIPQPALLLWKFPNAPLN